MLSSIEDPDLSMPYRVAIHGVKVCLERHVAHGPVSLAGLLDRFGGNVTANKELNTCFGPLEQITAFSHTDIQNTVPRASISSDQDGLEPVVEGFEAENGRLFALLDTDIWAGVVVLCDLGVDLLGLVVRGTIRCWRAGALGGC
jgi:hypothetical protein